VKAILKNTWAVLDKKEKKRFSGLIALDIIISILDILSLALLLWIIQFYIRPDQKNDLSFLPDWLSDKNSLWFIAIFFFFFGLKNLAAYLITKGHYAFLGNVAMRITHNNLLNYQQAGYDDFVNIDSSVHVRRISFQPFEFCQHVLSGIQQIITQSCLILITIIAIVIFDAKLFLILVCILLPPVAVIFYFIKNRLNKAKKHIRSSNEQSFRHLFDALKGYVESNIYDRNDFFMRRYITERKIYTQHLFESMSIQNMPPRIIEIFAVLGLFILIAIAQGTGNTDTATLITIGAFMAAAYKIIPGIVKVINLSGLVKAYEFTATDLVQEVKPAKPKTTVPVIQSIELRDINFQYKDQPVLSNLSFTVKKGDFLGIIGRSGKGKTTLFNLLLGFLSPSTGTLFINETGVSNEDIKNYWPHISYVRQQSFFIHDTIRRNITLQEDNYDKEKLNYAIRTAGLEELIAQSAEGLDKEITENGKNISGGQQQRVALARALYKNADCILLDEPFNELDETSTIALLEYFRELSQQGKTIIMITHDKKSQSYCNKIISLDE
jgi:ABC-type multidrug transport system fused ATPase/permease subunit